MTISLKSLQKRSDFLALRSAPSIGSPAFRLVRGIRPQSPEMADTDTTIRVGFTVTKKMGNAVIRNRIKRRLKSVTEAVFPLQAEANADYVVIARRSAFDRPYDLLVADMEKAIQALKSDRHLKPDRRVR